MEFPGSVPEYPPDHLHNKADSRETGDMGDTPLGHDRLADSVFSHAQAALLAIETRDQYPENLHYGGFVVSDAMGHIVLDYPQGVGTARTFFRSSAKPFQALPLVRALGDRHQLSGFPVEALALCCASHGASEAHLKWVDYLLAQAQQDETALQCGPHPPLDEEALTRWQQSAQPLSKRYNNCSGKHGGMVLACVLRQWNVATYLDQAHPLQTEILATVADYTGWTQDIPRALDGCGAPVFYLPMAAMATAYARLVERLEAAPLVEAMTSFPDLVGGVGRIDSALMAVTQGRLLAKVGADGVIAVAHCDRKQGLFLKLLGGENAIRNWVIPEILLQLQWMGEEEYLHPVLAPYRDFRRLNTQGVTIGSVHLQVNIS